MHGLAALFEEQKRHGCTNTDRSLKGRHHTVNSHRVVFTCKVPSDDTWDPMTQKQVVLTCKVSDGQRKLSKRCSRSQTLLCMFQRAPQTEPQRCVKREVVRQMRADCPGVGWVGGRTVATDVAGARRSMFHTPLVSPSGQRRTTAGGKGQHSQFC